MPLFKLEASNFFAAPHKVQTDILGAVNRCNGLSALLFVSSASATALKPEAPDPLLLKGITGACKMLGKIAENPSNIDAIIQADGLPAITNALQATQGEGYWARRYTEKHLGVYCDV